MHNNSNKTAKQPLNGRRQELYTAFLGYNGRMYEQYIYICTLGI